VTFISVSEVLAALGLILPGAVLEVLAVAGILPAVVGIAAVLVPLAAVGLVLLMIGATITHAIRREWTMIRIVPSVATTLPSPGSFSPPVKTNTPASSGRPSPLLRTPRSGSDRLPAEIRSRTTRSFPRHQVIRDRVHRRVR
jgi:hypothetical protein